MKINLIKKIKELHIHHDTSVDSADVFNWGTKSGRI